LVVRQLSEGALDVETQDLALGTFSFGHPSFLGDKGDRSNLQCVFLRGGIEMNNQLRPSPIIALVIALLIAVGVPNIAMGAPVKPSHQSRMMKQITLRMDMRKLWEDHITWTRIFIISAVADLPDKDAATQRLLRNQVDIGNAIKPFYGTPPAID
jgi:hypothetical protein